MKKGMGQMVCTLAFLSLCVLVVAFLRYFTETPPTVTYLKWESGIQLTADGRELPYDPASFELPQGAEGSTFRLGATLPQTVEPGSALLFEISGLEVELTLDGALVYQGRSPAWDAALAHSSYTLPDGVEGAALEMTCRLLGGEGNCIFPPLLRLSTDPAMQVEDMAYANSSALPAGAAALAFVLVCGLFLLGLSRGRRDWYLLPLALAAAILTFRPLVVSGGYYFLPRALSDALAWDGWPVLATAAMLLYLLLGRRHGFLRQLGVVALWSGGVLACLYAVSLARGSYLSRYLSYEVSALFSRGYYDGLFYWLNLWLVAVCTALSAYAVAQAFAKSAAEAEALAQRERLARDSYRALEARAKETAALRHEMGHQIAALDLLYQQGNLPALGEELERLKGRQAGLAPVRYARNFILNAILQDAAARAAERGIRFQAEALTPEQLPIPAGDLCSLLMNLLDNALEAAGAVSPPEARFIRFQASVKQGYLAIFCENSYSGRLELDGGNLPRSAKSGPEPHGLGLLQMQAVAEKYHSVLSLSHTEGVFTVQTALLLPK